MGVFNAFGLRITCSSAGGTDTYQYSVDGVNWTTLTTQTDGAYLTQTPSRVLRRHQQRNSSAHFYVGIMDRLKFILLILLCLPALAHGQVGTALCSNAAASGISITCVSASGVTAGSLVMLPFISDNGGGGGNAAVSSIAGCGTSGTAPFATGDWKIATSQNNNSDSGWIFYNENAAGAAGPCTITLTLAVSQNHLSIAGVQYSGLPTAYALDTMARLVLTARLPPSM